MTNASHIEEKTGGVITHEETLRREEDCAAIPAGTTGGSDRLETFTHISVHIARIREAWGAGLSRQSRGPRFESSRCSLTLRGSGGVDRRSISAPMSNSGAPEDARQQPNAPHSERDAEEFVDSITGQSVSLADMMEALMGRR